MLRIASSLALGLLAVRLAAAPAGAVETRTYRFTPDGSLPYSTSCGECAPPYLGSKSDIAGMFTVEFDQAAGTGTLLSIDDELVNYFAVVSTPSGPELEPYEDAPPGGIIPDAFFTLNPPFAGTLTEEGDTLRLANDLSLSTSFILAMTGHQATLSLNVPIIDAWVTVTNAPAEFVPEPAAWTTLLIATATLAGRRARRS